MKFSGVVAAILTAVLLTGAALPGVRSVLINRRPYHSVRDLGRYYGMTARNYGKTATLSRGSDRMSFTVHQRRMTFNGVRISQGFAPAAGGGGFFISRDDWNGTFQPLLFPWAVRRHGIRTVFIDCGHGGADKGASGRYSVEKAITLRIGLRVAAILRASGFQVRLSRARDAAISLGARAAAANRAGSDVFISIHVNSAGDRTVSGIETFCMTPSGAPSSSDSKAVYRRYAGNANDANNLVLAYRIQKALLGRTRAVDRGVKRARFAVLRDIKMPGVLVEVGFISNSGDERLLNTPAYVEKLARGIVDGLLAYQRQVSRRR